VRMRGDEGCMCSTPLKRFSVTSRKKKKEGIKD
jgi:hypothetical protein